MALNKQDLINGFCKAGINKGDEIEVHSSLSSFGYVDGGAETVISALKETVAVRQPGLQRQSNEK